MISPLQLQHRALIPPDDGEQITFKWHFARGMLAPRMSGFELSQFILSHMPAIFPLLKGHKRVQEHFKAIYVLLSTNPKEATDELLPWIKSVTRREDDDVIEMNLFAEPESSRKTFSFQECLS